MARRYTCSAVRQPHSLRSRISALRQIASSPRSRIRFARTNALIGERRFIARNGRRPFLTIFVPIWSGDTYMGFAALGITTRALSTLAKELSDPPRSVSFMLYGHDRVLAHPLITEGSPRQSENASFPLLRNFGDPVIENLTACRPCATSAWQPRPACWRVNRRSAANTISSLHARSATTANCRSRSACISSSARSMVRSGCSIGQRSLRSDCWDCHSSSRR